MNIKEKVMVQHAVHEMCMDINILQFTLLGPSQGSFRPLLRWLDYMNKITQMNSVNFLRDEQIVSELDKWNYAPNVCAGMWLLDEL